MLTDGNATGYDLKKCFESSFGHFFAAGYGSIYPALSSLSADGHVSCEEVPQDGKPDRKVYSITAAGHAELKRALDNPKPGHKVRSEFLAMLCFSHLMEESQIDSVIEHRIGKFDELLQLFDAFDEEAPDVPDGAKFVAGFGRAVATACRDYMQENRGMLVATDTRKIESAAG